jgi:hypothetical protein
MNVFQAVCRRAADFNHYARQDITDLAVLWTLALTEVPTTLISTASMVNMEKNLALAWQKIMPEQKWPLRNNSLTCFSNNWENIEVSQYWDKMEEGTREQSRDVLIEQV